MLFDRGGSCCICFQALTLSHTRALRQNQPLLSRTYTSQACSYYPPRILYISALFLLRFMKIWLLFSGSSLELLITLDLAALNAFSFLQSF